MTKQPDTPSPGAFPDLEDDDYSPSQVCPECRAPLNSLDLYGHSLTHWPSSLDPQRSSAIARARQAQLAAGGISPRAYDVDHKED